MNSEKLGKIRFSFVFLFCFVISSLYSINYNLCVNRYLNDNKQTVFEIIYKIPNNQLSFKKVDENYVAPIDITLNLIREGQVVLTKPYYHNAGARTEASAVSSNFYTIDKMTMTLTKPGFSAEVKIKDLNSADSLIQKIDLPLLDSLSHVSDIEISQNVVNSASTHLEKFHRGDFLFYVDPAPVFQAVNDTVYLYYEIYNLKKGENKACRYTQTISIFNENNQIIDEKDELITEELPVKKFKKVSLSNCVEGYYTVLVKIVDLEDGSESIAKNNLSIVKEYVKITRIFDTDEDEFLLMSYFFNSNEKKQWSKLNNEGKKNMIDRFWKSKDSNPTDEQNDFIEVLKSRIDYSNKNFSHYEKGWKTDQGRLYIKYGEPDEIVNGVTLVNARYSRKDYRIWKYNGKDKFYVLLDNQNNGNFRVIKSKNDSTEKTDPNWKSFIINTKFADLTETGWQTEVDDDLKTLILDSGE